MLISGLLSAASAPADLLRAVDRGELDLVISETLVGELRRALAYPKLRRRIPAADAEAAVAWVRGSAALVPDQAARRIHSQDAADDHLIALAESQRAALVSGDKHLLALAGEIPVFTPRQFLRLIAGD